MSFFDLGPQDVKGLREALKAAKHLIETVDKRVLYERIKERKVSINSLRFCQEVLDSVFIGQLSIAYNIGINEGRAAGRTIDHLHIHLIPRYE